MHSASNAPQDKLSAEVALREARDADICRLQDNAFDLQRQLAALQTVLDDACPDKDVEVLAISLPSFSLPPCI